MEPTVVALGGNALLRGGEGSVAEQRQRLATTRERLRPLHDRGHDLVFTHGNGPQVGSRLLAEEESSGPAEPLDVIGAETQAQIGYLLAQELGSTFGGHPTTVVTRTRVDPDDPAFEDPTKPVGPYYSEREADRKPFDTTRVYRDGEPAYRRVVPSPEPRAVLEADRIARLAGGEGGPVICGGGGGVPVVPRAARSEPDASGGDPGFDGVPAVVDKDYTSVLVADAVGADELLFLTDVDAVYLDYGTPNERAIGEATPGELREPLDAGQFPAGSMGPKVEAACRFVEEGGGRAVVTSPERLVAALDGEGGTRVVPEQGPR